MIRVRKKFAIPVTLLTLLSATASAAYLTETFPFEQRGIIKESDTCESLGDPEQVTPRLNRRLPFATNYAFKDDPGSRFDKTESYFNSHCSVAGDGEVLLFSRTEMMRSEPANSWARYVMEEGWDDKASDFDSFPAGAKGVASKRVAAIFIPCVPRGMIPGGEYNLSVVVRSKEDLIGTETEARNELINIALSAAKHAHTSANCDLPSQLPHNV